MKKWNWCLLVILCLLFTSTAEAEHKLLDIGDNQRVMDSAVVGNRAYFLTDSAGELKMLTPESQELVTVYEPSSDTEMSFQALIDLSDGVFASQTGSGSLVQLITADGSIPAEPSIIQIPLDISWDEYYMDRFAAVDETIYFVLCSLISDEYQLCRFERDSDALMQIPYQNINAYLPYKEGKVLLEKYDDAGMALFEYDWETRESLPVGTLPQSTSGLYYDMDRDLLYYSSGSILVKCSLGASTEKLGPISFDSSFATASMIDGRYYVSIGSTGLIYLFDITSETKLQSLSVLGGWNGESGHKVFLMEHPDVAINTSDNTFEIGSTQNFIQGLLTGALSHDVIRFQTNDFDLSLLMKKGYCESIDSSSYAYQQVMQMYPSMRSAITMDGALYAVPMAVSASPWETYYDTLWSNAGLTSEQLPKTFPEFLDFVSAWAEDDQEYAINEFGDYRKWLVNMLLNRYTALYEYTHETLTFDTELFRQSLEKISDAAETLQDFQIIGPPLFGYGDILYDKLLALPLANELPAVISANMTVYVINPLSENKELALDYINCLLQNMDDKNRIALYPDEDDPVEDSRFSYNITAWNEEDERLQKQLESVEDGIARKELEEKLEQHKAAYNTLMQYRYSISQQSVDYYKQVVAPSLIFPNTGLFASNALTGEMMNDLIERYIDGTLDAASLIRELDNKIKLMQLELN